MRKHNSGTTPIAQRALHAPSGIAYGSLNLKKVEPARTPPTQNPGFTRRIPGDSNRAGCVQLTLFQRSGGHVAGSVVDAAWGVHTRWTLLLMFGRRWWSFVGRLAMGKKTELSVHTRRIASIHRLWVLVGDGA